MAERIVFTDSDFGKYSLAHSNVNNRIMPMSDAVSSAGPEATGIQKKDFGLVPYAKRFLQFLWIFWWCYAL